MQLMSRRLTVPSAVERRVSGLVSSAGRKRIAGPSLCAQMLMCSRATRLFVTC
jgi:hypothetical protein